ncbi:MAG: metallophosphoesterase [Candidatus Micrarchaeia archaeon]
MMIDKDIEALDGLPILYIKSLKMIVASDMHLGYEGYMARHGALIPKVNLKSIIKQLDRAISETGAESLLIDGDVKNEFSTVGTDEFNELHDFIDFAKSKGIKTIFVKGNHDNFIDRYKEPFGLEIYDEYAVFGSYLFFHGDFIPKDVIEKRLKFKTAIIGHEHPAISIYLPIGKKEKLKCFLIGSFGNAKLVVMPAIGYFSTSTGINEIPKEELMSPIFKNEDVDKFEAIAIGYNSTMSFGKIGELRSIFKRHDL